METTHHESWCDFRVIGSVEQTDLGQLGDRLKAAPRSANLTLARMGEVNDERVRSLVLKRGDRVRVVLAGRLPDEYQVWGQRWLASRRRYLGCLVLGNLHDAISRARWLIRRAVLSILSKKLNLVWLIGSGGAGIREALLGCRQRLCDQVTSTRCLPVATAARDRSHQTEDEESRNATAIGHTCSSAIS